MFLLIIGVSLKKIILSTVSVIMSVTLLVASVTQLKQHNAHHDHCLDNIECFLANYDFICPNLNYHHHHHGCQHNHCFLCSLHIDKACQCNNGTSKHYPIFEMFSSCNCINCLNISVNRPNTNFLYKIPLYHSYDAKINSVRGSPIA